MTGTVLLTVAALAAHADGDTSRPTNARSPFDRALAGETATVRGQSAFTGPVLGTPQPVTTYYQTPTYGTPTTPGYTDPTFGNSVPGVAAPYSSDPWVNGGTMPYGYGNPYPGTAPGSYAIGLNGAQPYKYGWTHRYDVGYMPSVGTNIPGGGDLGIFEVNVDKEFSAPIWNNWTFTAGGQFNLRSYDGPYAKQVAVGDAFPVAGGFLPAAPELPGSVYRFGLDLRLRTPTVGPWTFEAGFNPAIASDLQTGLDDDAWLYDGNIAAYFRPNPVWTFVVGAMYWDRVDDLIIPNVGVVLTPNDYLELRLVFPKPRVSLFVGTPFGLPTWIYMQGEYHVEAYQVAIDGPAAFDTSGGGLVSADELIGIDNRRVQLEDWRVTGGFYVEGPAWTAFIEAGAAFERQIKYSATVQGFDADPAFLLRMGVRY